MTMYMTRAPMNKGELDRHLNAMGWRRQGNEAQQKDDASAFIHDIDKVPAASGRMHILMEAKTSAAQSVARSLGCITDEDPDFWETLGIEIELETQH